MQLLYRIAILFYVFGIRIASLFSLKARLWVRGRKNWKKNLKDSGLTNQPLVLFHCASLGEFEMARPLIEWFKSEKPQYKIALSFFSPSGYEIRKDYPLADLVFYLPSDTPFNAKDMAALLRPDMVFFAKYEFWHFHLNALKDSGARLFAFSSVFRSSHRFFKWYGGLFRSDLKLFERIFVQDESSLDLLRSIAIDHAEVAGDTRFDRVARLAEQAEDFPNIRKLAGNRKIIIAGSSWPDEEQRMARVINDKKFPELFWIIAPHDISPSHIAGIDEILQVPRVKYSEINESSQADVLIIDNVGMLMSLYRIADLAIIGGGFTGKLHNILEPAAFGCPVLFGPSHHRFREAGELILAGGAVEFNQDLADRLDAILNDQWQLQKMSANAKEFVQSHRGATEKIMNHIFG